MIIFFITFLTIAVIVVVCMCFAECPSTNNAYTYTPIKQVYPVSEEQMNIFQNNWTLQEFKKEFGNFKVKNCTNHTTFETFKSCLFIKGFFTKQETWVRLASSLGEPSEYTIRRREKELMVGFTGKNYVLYDNKIQKWECQEIDLGL